MIGRAETLNVWRALLEGSRIAVVSSKRDVPAAGVAVVPSRSSDVVIEVFYRGTPVTRVADIGGRRWQPANASRSFTTLEAACFAAVANHLTLKPPTPHGDH